MSRFQEYVAMTEALIHWELLILKRYGRDAFMNASDRHSRILNDMSRYWK